VPEDASRRGASNAATEFIAGPVARGLGDKVAFTDGTRTLTYAELQDRVQRFAGALIGLGLRRESRIILVLPDTVDFPVAFWGAIHAGIIAVPVNPQLPLDTHAYVLDDSRAAAVVVGAPFAPAIMPLVERAASRPVVILAGDATHSRCLHLDSLLAQSDPAPLSAPAVADEVAFWLYTSGSTGDPKGVKHVHASPMVTARLFGQGVLGICQDDVVFSAAKLSFAYGLGNAMTFPLSVGASAVLMPDRPTPEKIFAIMRRHHPSLFFAVPSLYAAMLAHGELGRGAGSDRLRLCVSAGEALPAHLGERWRSITGVDILDGIGSTEMLQTFLSNRPGDVRYGSTGRPVPGYDVRLIDENGRDLGDGEIGELVVSGPSAAEGYWNQRAKTRRTFDGEWVHTGDRFLRDTEGYYHYCGRSDDMFKVNGLWVSPFDVEAALVSHDAVLEAAVIGRADGDGLMKPKAFVVLKPGVDADASLVDVLKAHVRERAGPWKYPRWIEIRRELPRTATGKIQRFKLREEEAGHPAPTGP
jgi:4-hydroxybenzoate-CoA ligase